MPRTRYFLFQYGDTDQFAISSDEAGRFLPKGEFAWCPRAELTEHKISEAMRAHLELGRYKLVRMASK